MPKEFLTIDQIPIASEWHAADGSGHKVTIISKYWEEERPDVPFSEKETVRYSWQENGNTKTHEKSLFSFQVRYYLPE
jgi:hypothetical protein